MQWNLDRPELPKSAFGLDMPRNQTDISSALLVSLFSHQDVIE